ncbi:class V chitinase [Aspergillus luchuensis]|uniref:Class V chitinase n=2 Tax=Aspergillus kawachii TaxID=1069201 RepID=A0A146FZV8_ASPKA|nr:class V chitinase [Aspergillus luchuensis]
MAFLSRRTHDPGFCIASRRDWVTVSSSWATHGLAREASLLRPRCLSRYIALLLRGERQLPAGYADQARRDGAAEREYYCISPDVNSMVDYNTFMESVARRIGCETYMPLSCVIFFNLHILTVALVALRCCSTTLIPFSMSALLVLWLGTAITLCTLHDELLIKWWLYPHWGVWYRYRGPGANPPLLNALLARLSPRNSTVLDPLFITYLVWFIDLYPATALDTPVRTQCATICNGCAFP